VHSGGGNMSSPYFKIIGSQADPLNPAGVMLQGIGHDLRTVDQVPSVGGVLSVTGYLMDNTDPDNPFAITPSSIFANSITTTVVNSDPADPSYLLGLTIQHADDISLVDAATGAIVNDTGRTITMTGSISYNPVKGGGAAAQLNIVSERSNDLGVSWFGNLNSRRTVEVANSAESFGTKVSLIIDWEPDQWLRFRVWLGAGVLSFVSTSTIAMGETFVTPSIVWELAEI
jgi:hypothetical protein